MNVTLHVAACVCFRRLTRNKTVAARDRLTIYFHAVLSKDFKLVPNEDRIFIRAGNIIGNWEDDTLELSVTRYLFLQLTGKPGCS